MTLLAEILVSLLAAFGLVCLAWLIYGKLLLPVGCARAEVSAQVTASGSGEGLEQAVSGLLWLRRTGLWRGRILIRDAGLWPEGLALARRLTDLSGVELRAAGPGGETAPETP